MPRASRLIEAARDVTIDMVTWRPGQPTRENTYRVARELHGRTSGATSRAGLALVNAIHRPAALPARGDLTEEWARALDQVAVDGVSVAPSVLGPEAIARIREFATHGPGVLRSATGATRRGTLGDRDSATVGVHLVEQFVLEQPDIQALIASDEVRRFAGAHFAAPPVIHPPSLYWTCAGATVTDDERRRGARQFHWDYDGLAGLRLHLYLTDVDEGSAPMSYVAGSHRRGSLSSRQLRQADMGIADDDLWSAMPRSALRTITGHAGTMFISDSQGLHAGSDARTADRLFLVMPIQATGFAGYQLRPRSVRPRDPEFTERLRRQAPDLMFFRERLGGTR